jgi:hypothetical protein
LASERIERVNTPVQETLVHSCRLLSVLVHGGYGNRAKLSCR